MTSTNDNTANGNAANANAADATDAANGNATTTATTTTDNAAYIRQLTKKMHLFGLDATRQMLASDTYDSNLTSRQVEAVFREAKTVYDRECRIQRKFEAEAAKQAAAAKRVKNAKRNAKKRAAKRRILSRKLEQQATDLRQAVAQKAKKGDQHTPVGRDEMEAMEAKAAALMARAAAMMAAAGA